MEMKRMDPKKQFSKRLARWTAVFWFVFMAWLGTVLFLAPEAGMYSVYMSIVVSVVMIINIWQYNSNSKTEKALFAFLNEKELELKLGPAKLAIGNNNNGCDSDGENALVEEGESNG